MHKFIFILFFGLTFFLWATAQKKYIYQDSTLKQAEELYDTSGLSTKIENTSTTLNSNANDTIYIDTTLYYNPLFVSADSVKAWKNLPSFAYVNYLDSLLKAKQKNLKKENADDKTNSASPGDSWLNEILSSSVLQIFLWIIAAIFIVFILYKLFLAEGLFKKNIPIPKATTSMVNEEIGEDKINFETAIAQAQKTGNYRLAVRFHYLQTLHWLDNKKLITLAKDKTNYQYVQEITNKNYQNNFAALTLNYEYVWYGECNIDMALYNKIQSNFLQFNNLK